MIKSEVNTLYRFYLVVIVIAVVIAIVFVICKSIKQGTFDYDFGFVGAHS